MHMLEISMSSPSLFPPVFSFFIIIYLFFASLVFVSCTSITTIVNTFFFAYYVIAGVPNTTRWTKKMQIAFHAINQNIEVHR